MSSENDTNFCFIQAVASACIKSEVIVSSYVVVVLSAEILIIIGENIQQ